LAVAYAHYRNLVRSARKGWDLVPVIVVAADVEAGTTLTTAMIAQRPLPSRFVTPNIVKPEQYTQIVGEKLLVGVKKGDLLLSTELAAAFPRPVGAPAQQSARAQAKPPNSLLAPFAPRTQVTYAPAPTAYTLTELDATSGAIHGSKTIVRDGSMAVVDFTPATDVPPYRTLVDIANDRSFRWVPSMPSVKCTSARAYWADPFAFWFAEKRQSLAGLPEGEIVNGFRTRIIELDPVMLGTMSVAKSRAWLEPTYGLTVKWASEDDGSTLLEVKSLTVGKPAADLFTLPPACVKLASQTPTEAQRPPGHLHQ
jgi:hypothetical protein